VSWGVKIRVSGELGSEDQQLGIGYGRLEAFNRREGEREGRKEEAVHVCVILRIRCYI